MDWTNLTNLFQGFLGLTLGNVAMIAAGGTLIFLAISKE